MLTVWARKGKEMGTIEEKPVESHKVRIRELDYEKLQKQAKQLKLSQVDILTRWRQSFEKEKAENRNTAESAAKLKRIEERIEKMISLQYRLIRELCRITDSDVEDPDSGFTWATQGDDQLLNPWKYTDERR